jgi:hypothetical protein
MKSLGKEGAYAHVITGPTQLGTKLPANGRMRRFAHQQLARFGVALSAACALTFGASAAHAGGSTGSRAMFQSGLWTFAGSYVPAVVVATVSPYSFDKPLYIPIAGPWIDLATRDCPRCNHEVVNKVLLVGSGVFQAVGATNILGSLFFGGRHTATAPSPGQTAITAISPARMGANGYGAIAQGTF